MKTHIFSDPIVGHEIATRIFERERRSSAKLHRGSRVAIIAAAAWLIGAALFYLLN